MKSYSDLQRQFISAELGRRETVSRKALEAAWRSTRDDLATAPSLATVLFAGR